MKVSHCFLVLVIAVVAHNGNGNGNEDYESNDDNYKYQCAVEDAEAGLDFGHMEAREEDVATGKYYVPVPDGRKQTVEYTGSEESYVLKVIYE